MSQHGQILLSFWRAKGIFVVLLQYHSSISVHVAFFNHNHALTLILRGGGEEPWQIYACLGVAS